MFLNQKLSEIVKISPKKDSLSSVWNCVELKSVQSRNMCDSVVPVKETFSRTMVAKCPIGQCAKSVLRRAIVEKRLTIGLLPAIKYLSQDSAAALFCFTAAAPSGDSATHMQEVLLQAFCVENDICVVKVDSTLKMKRLLRSNNPTSDFNCVLVHYPFLDPYSDTREVNISTLSAAEKYLIDHYEAMWSNQPVIKLPEK